MSSALASLRTRAFHLQHGFCFYCNQPMWERNPQAFSRAHGLSLRQAMQLRATAEHLVARCDGGEDSANNIVAACHQCNQGRHRRRYALPPEQFRQFVRYRLSTGRWHGLMLVHCGHDAAALLLGSACSS